MKKVIVTMLLCFALSGALQAAGAAQYTRDGVGAAEIALGSAYTGAAEGVNSVYWNPAGLSRMEAYEWQVSTMYTAETLGRYHGYIGVAKKTDDIGSFGLNLTAFGISDIEIYDEGGNMSGKENDREFLFGASYANKAGYQFMYGLTLKGLYQDLAGYRGIGYGIDIGAQFRPLLEQEIYVGVMLQNIAGSLAWQGYSDDVATSYRAGVSGTFFDEIFKACFDAVKEEGVDNLIFRGGLEFKIIEMVAIRFGIDEKYPSAGIGFEYGGYAVDYAYVYNRQELGDAHQFSLALMW